MSYCKVKNCRFPHSHTTRGHKCGNCNKYGHGIMECGDLYKLNNLKQFLNDTLPNDIQCDYINCNNREYHTREAHVCDYCNSIGHDISDCPFNSVEIVCPICREKNIIPNKQQKVYGGNSKCSICLDNDSNIFLPKCGHLCVCLECCKKMNIKKKINLIDRIDDESILPEYLLKDIRVRFNNNNNKIYFTKFSGMGSSWYIRRSNRYSPFEVFFMDADMWGQYGENLDDRPILNLFKHGYDYINY